MNKQCPLHKVILINLQWAFCIRRIMARKHFDDYYNSCYIENENGTDPREKWRGDHAPCG